MRTLARTALIAGLALVPLAPVTPVRAAEPAPSPQALVAAADRTRNPGEPFRVTVALQEYVRGRARDRLLLMVYASEDPRTRQFRNLMRYVEPPRDAGKMALLDAPSLWFYDPASKASVRISAQQRLVGQASDADVLTVNLARDYRARLIGEETLQDADRKDRDCWHLDLTAATPDAMYSRLEYWIERGTDRPVKAKFYSDSGRLLKIAYYRKYRDELGGLRPTETIIIDAVDTSLVTTVTTSDYRAQPIPDAWFQRDFLPRLRFE